MLFCNIGDVVKKGGFTEGHNETFWSKEAAVAELAKGHFWDKLLRIKGLFEISKVYKTGLKGGKMGGKSGVKEKFSICRFRLKKVKKHTFLRMDKRLLDIGYWLFVRRWDCGNAFSKVTVQKTARMRTAKTQKDARQNPSETDFPRFFLILRRNPMLK